jgi:hypothetical protein
MSWARPARRRSSRAEAGVEDRDLLGFIEFAAVGEALVELVGVVVN